MVYLTKFVYIFCIISLDDLCSNLYNFIKVPKIYNNEFYEKNYRKNYYDLDIRSAHRKFGEDIFWQRIVA